MASTETTQTPAIIAVLPAMSVKAERGMISSTTRMVRAASARMVILARTRATPLWLRISEVVFCGSRFMGGNLTPVAARCRPGRAATVKRVAFGAVFGTGRAPVHVLLSGLALVCCLLLNEYARLSDP